MEQNIFVGRQPILDASRRVVAYELLYRDAAAANSAVFAHACQAATRVIANTFSSMGADAVLGRCKGFVNVTAELLTDDLLRVLPADRIVVEVLESVEPTAAVVEACRELKASGFTLALDDYVLDDPRECMLDLVSVVKVDLPAVPQAQLGRLVRKLRRQGVDLLAEKVETAEEFEACRKLGFDLFQGFFFARPMVVQAASLDPARATLMNVLAKIEQDADSAALADPIKSQVQLSVNLLRLVNSAASARPQAIDKVEDAIVHMGRQQLRRWMTILLYAGGDSDGAHNPLLRTAAYRGKMMELAAGLGADGQVTKDQQERAFLTGMLSLVDVLLGRPMPELLDQLGVSPEIRDALLQRQGTLGRLFEMVEHVEGNRLPAVIESCGELGLDAGVPELQQADLQSHAWVNDLTSGF